MLRFIAAISLIAMSVFPASALGVFRLQADCMAVADGIADDTVAIQTCINNAQISGGIVLGEIGTYRTTACLSVIKTITIQGQGYAAHRQFPLAPNATVFKPTTDFLCVNSMNPVFLEKFQVNFAPGVNTLKGIILDGSPGTFNTDSIIRDVFIVNANQCIVTVNAARFRVDNVTMEGCGQVSMVAQHVNDPDGGDGYITNTTFSGQPTFAHLFYASGGVLRVINNKFNGGGNVAIYALINSCPLAGFGAGFFIGNSIEGTPYGIIWQQQPGCNSTFDSAMIMGNEVKATIKGLWFRAGGVSGGWLKTVTVVGNTFITGNPATGIVVDANSVTNYVPGLNAFQ